MERVYNGRNMRNGLQRTEYGENLTTNGISRGRTA
jgi:hypothetical protein